MPSTSHEALIEMFRHRPRLAAELLAGPFGMPIPDYEQARLEAGDFTDLTPAEYRADVVVVLAAGPQPLLAVVVEVQLGRDRAKRWSWPVYLTTLRARMRCPAVLLVVCTDGGVATWCGKPIELGHPGAVVAPLVLGPDRVPMVTDPVDAGRHPELAVLSAMTHGADPGKTAVLQALPGALAAVDQLHAALYSDIVLATLPVVARRFLEELMATGTYEYQSEFVRKYILQGREEGREEGWAAGRVETLTTAVLEVLETRGLTVPDAVRARIRDCGDPEQLDRWLRRAVTAGSADELFD